MSKHNYSQYSSNKKNNHYTDQTGKDEVFNTFNVEPSQTLTLMDETVDTVALPETVEGVVINCAKLNVRAEPSVDADVICVLNANSEIEINVTKSTDKWFNVCTATGIEGYCMRQYVDARL